MHLARLRLNHSVPIIPIECLAMNSLSSLAFVALGDSIRIPCNLPGCDANHPTF